MRYRRKPAIVEAFKLDTNVDIVSPDWFQREIEKNRIYIDRCIVDGAVRIYGCSIYTKGMRAKARIGDYIIKEPSGEIKVCKPKEFFDDYERMK